MNRKSCEYSLTELWDDPIVELLMKSDGTDRASVERLLAGIGPAGTARRCDRARGDA